MKRSFRLFSCLSEVEWKTYDDPQITKHKRYYYKSRVFIQCQHCHSDLPYKYSGKSKASITSTGIVFILDQFRIVQRRHTYNS